MKTKMLLLAGLLLLFGIMSSKISEASEEKDSENQTKMNVLCTPDLFDLTSKWVAEYGKLHPELKINVIISPDINAATFQSSKADVGFISNPYYSKLKTESLWKIVVGRDVIVPVVNAGNPFINELYKKGIKQSDLVKFIEDPANQTWGTLLNNDQNIPAKYYITNDPGLKSGLAAFLNIKPDKIAGITVESSDEMISKIQRDPNAVGFCKINTVLDKSGEHFVHKIRLLPIDRNANGRMDYMEKIYNDMNTFHRGVWIGKYPRVLCSNIYSIATSVPENDSEQSFLKWVISDGQKYLATYGYHNLAQNERESQMANLAPIVVKAESPREMYNIPKLAIIILVMLVAFLFGLDLLGRYLGSAKNKIHDSVTALPQGFNESSVSVPKGLYYDKTHTWAFMEADGMVKIGMDDFFQHITGLLTGIRMKQPGEKIKKGELLFSVVQNGKQLNIYAPLSGTVIAQNIMLTSNASLINSSPYNDGWVYTIEPTNWLREIQFLVMAETYTQWIKKEFSRLKDFLALNLKVHKLEYAQVMMQDGGELKDNVLEELGPEVWDDFQTNFIDSFK